MKRFFSILVLSVMCAAQTTHVTANLDVNNIFTGNNQFTLPFYVGSGVPISQTNECGNITTDSSGGSASAAAAIRTINSGVAHDVLCLITADATHPSAIGSLVFPYFVSFSTNSSMTQFVAGLLESVSGAATGGGMVLTNNGGVTRSSFISFRACNGPAVGQGCGTDFLFYEDPTHSAKEEYLMALTGDGNPMYIGNVLNSNHAGIYFGGSDASTGAVFGIDRALGSQSHIVRLSSFTDVWGTLTLSTGGTVSLAFNRAYASTPICIATYQGSGGLTGILSCTPSTTGITIASSVTSDRAVVAYEILGNNN